MRRYGESASVLVDYETAAQRILESAEASPDNQGSGRSVLSVCNTVGSTTQLTETVAEATHEGDLSVTRLGTVYRSALQACTSENYQRAGEPALVESSLRPSERAVAAETLWRLGLRPLESDSDTPLEDQDWRLADDNTTLYLGTLTSRIRPRDRRSLIIVANVLARADVPFVFVSTQAIEAGVDISFATAYRDIAPVDSIVQTAGRCNRSFEWGHENGKVTLWALAPAEGTSDPPAMYVYQPPEQLDRVARLLDDECHSREGPELAETVLTRTVIPEYFEWIEEQDLERRAIRTAIEDCDADALSREHLIDDTYETVDVIVAETAIEQQLINQIMDAFGHGDLPAAFALLKSLSDLRISVPVTDVKSVPTQVFSLTSNEDVDIRGCTSAGDGAIYDIGRGGFITTEDDGISGRFTFN